MLKDKIEYLEKIQKSRKQETKDKKISPRNSENIPQGTRKRKTKSKLAKGSR